MRKVISDLNQWPALSLLVADRWSKRPEPFMIELSEALPTWEQYAYLHAECLPKLMEALFDKGEIKKKTIEYTKYWLKRHIGYGEWLEVDEGKVFVPDSFGDDKVTMEILSMAIDESIDEAAKRDVIIQPPKGKNETV